MRPSSSFRQIAALLCRVILLACLCFSAPFAAQAGGQASQDAPAQLRLGFFLAPPHAYTLPSGRSGGAAVDLLVRHIAPRMGIPVEVVGPYPFARLLHDFDARKLDGILMLSRSPERELLFTFPETPFHSMSPSLAVADASPLTEFTPETRLEGKRVGTILGAWIPKILLTSGARLDPTIGDSSTALNLQKLIGGRVEAVYSPDAATLKEVIRRMPHAPAIRILPIPAPRLAVYTVFARHIPADIVKRYDKALQKVLSTISYKSLEQQHLLAPVR